VLKDRIVEMLKNHSVAAPYINQVQGEGGHGRRLSDMSGYNTNVEIKTLVSPEISDAILWAVKEHKGKHALIAFRQNVEACLRLHLQIKTR